MRAGRGRAGSAAAEAETRCRGGKVAGRGAPRHLPAPCGVGAYSPGKGGAGAKQTHQLPHKGARGPGTCTPAGPGSQRPSAALRTAKAPPHRAAVRPWGQQDFLQLGKTSCSWAWGRASGLEPAGMGSVDNAKRAWIWEHVPQGRTKEALGMQKGGEAEL